MKHILARDNARVLEQVTWANVLLAFDFDGTLAPIVHDRDEAKMRARTRALLERLVTLYPCAVISGRSQADVKARLDGARVGWVIGNHGLEPGARNDTFRREVAAATESLTRALRGVQGVEVEDKRLSLAIHYRRSRTKRAVRAAIRAAVAALPTKMRLIPGKLVVNVLPASAPNKGDALLWVRDAARADTAVYVGDDVTDEDVFRLDQPGRLMTVRVGASRASRASYFIRDQREIDRFLERLALHRKGRGAA